MKNTKDIMYAIKLTAIICTGYGLVLAFMLLINKVWNMIGDNNVRNTIACVMLVAIFIGDYYLRRTENGTR